MKCRWSNAIQIVDMSMRSLDIRDQIRRLSKIAPNFGHFLPSKILQGAPFVQLVYTWSPWSRATSPGKVSWGYARYPQSHRRSYVLALLNAGGIVLDHISFRFWTSCLVPEKFAIKVGSCVKLAKILHVLAPNFLRKSPRIYGLAL